MATTTKLNIDRATVRQLFKAVTKAADEIKEKSIVHGAAKRVLQLQHLAQASEFYVPNGNHDRIALTTNGHPDIRAWSDRELVNTKQGWEWSPRLLWARYPSMVRSRIGEYQTRMGIARNHQQQSALGRENGYQWNLPSDSADNGRSGNRY